MFFYLLVLLIFNTITPNTVQSFRLNKNLQVKTRNGIVQGREEKTETGKKFYSYSGIPFAKPPIGELRWRTPQPVSEWNGILDATHEGPCCVAPTPESMNSFNFSSEGSEDCLYLNIFTPQNPKSVSNPLAVYIFIYGGGYLAGCANRFMYGPEYFMEDGIILVTFNYRVGLLGFLSTEDLECPGNWGIKDQVAAIRWVKDNIEYFGGDSGRITVGGQSAGAASVNMLLLSPKTKGLFQRVILESGSILCPWGNQENSREIAFNVGMALGIETGDSNKLISKLRHIDIEKLSRAIIPVLILETLMSLRKGFPFTPVVEPPHDDAILTSYGYDLLRDGKFPHIPILAGVTEFEFGFSQGTLKPFVPLVLTMLNVIPGFIVRNVKSIADRYIIGKRIQYFFTGSNNFNRATYKEFMQYIGEDQVYWPIQKGLSFLSEKNSVYFYVFSHEGNFGQNGLAYISNLKNKEIKGASHCEEMFYLFHGYYSRNPTKEDLIVSRKMLILWTNFIKFGNPTPNRQEDLDNIIWPTLIDQAPYVNIKSKLQIVNESYNELNYKFWENIYKEYSTEPFPTKEYKV